MTEHAFIGYAVVCLFIHYQRLIQRSQQSPKLVTAFSIIPSIMAIFLACTF